MKLDEHGCLEPGCHLVDGLAEQTIGSLSIHPNPTQAIAYVEFPKELIAESITLNLFDAMGRLIRSKQLSEPALGQRLLIDLAGLPNGVYHLVLQMNHAFFSGRIIKE